MSDLARSDVHVDRALSDFAIGIIDELNYAGDEAMPWSPQERESDKFHKWDTPTSRRIPFTLRAMKTRSRQASAAASTDTFSMEEYALHDVVPDRLVAHADEGLRLRETLTENLTQLLRLDRELRIKTLLQLNTNYPAANRVTITTNAWDHASAPDDPRDTVDEAIDNVIVATGGRPNLMIISKPVFNVLRRHPDVTEALKYTMAVTNRRMNAEILAEFFDIEKVVVADQVYETAVEGATSVPAYMWSDDVIVLRVKKNPSRIDKHFGTSFTTKQIEVKTWREEGIAGDIVEASLIVDEQIVDSSSGSHIASVLT